MKWLIAAAIVCAFAAGVVLGVAGYVQHYSHTSSPVGFHCWHEINNQMPSGVEKICMANN